MTHTCEMMWFEDMMAELSFLETGPMPMHCHDQIGSYLHS